MQASPRGNVAFGLPDIREIVVRKSERVSGSDVRLARPLAALIGLIAVGQVCGDALQQLVRRRANPGGRLAQPQRG